MYMGVKILKRKAIHLTFKDNEVEDNLYEWICKSTNKCCFIKDILLEAKRKEYRKKSKTGFLKLD